MRRLRVLVACEYSGRVRDAFARLGCDAWSCDLLPTERPGNHIQGDVLQVLDQGWDLLIAHPPCTDLAVSGARHFKEKIQDGRQASALDFVRQLMAAPVRFKAIENPKSVISGQIRKPDQIVQPWMFGHGETKETHLWLYGLPGLVATDVVEGRKPVCHHVRPGPDRWRIRSRTYLGIASAMALQWAPYVLEQLMKDPKDPGTSELTFADLDLPKPRGRPRKPASEKLTPAERAKRYRDKKRAQGVRLVPISADEAQKLRPAARFSGLFALDARLAGKFE